MSKEEKVTQTEQEKEIESLRNEVESLRRELERLLSNERIYQETILKLAVYVAKTL